MGDKLRVERDDGVVTVTMDAPPVNYFDRDMYVTVRQCFEELGTDPEVAAVILTGAGDRAFCAGNSLEEFVELDEREAVDHLMKARACFHAIYECGPPVVAAVNGPALGTGLAIASVCDIRLASTRSTFALPEIDVGILGGQRHLMRIAPQGLTRKMALTGVRLGAEEALRAGMVEEVHEPEALMGAARDLARTLASKSPIALRMAKMSLNAIERMELREGYEYECGLSTTLRGFPDSSKAAEAIIHKRPVTFEPPPAWADLLRILRPRS